MSVLTVSLVSRSALMDIDRKIRTFQDSNMTYQNVTERMAAGSDDFNFLWPEKGAAPIGSMAVQYKETDWNFAKRLAGRLGTVVVPDYLLDEPFISIGMTKRPVQTGIEPICYDIKKGIADYRHYQLKSDYAERDAISYVVKSREIFDLCDGIPFMDKPLFVYAIDTVYEGNELVHYYTLKEREGFFTTKLFNDNLAGASLHGTVRDIRQDTVQVTVRDDVEQTQHKWFPYATPFSQPAGTGWYFMPDIGDEIRLEFPGHLEDEAFVSSAAHITHGTRMEPEVKYIRTIYGQVIQFSPESIIINDGSGSGVIIDKSQGVSVSTDKSINLNAQSDIVLSATGRFEFSGARGVSVRNGESFINIKNTINAKSQNTQFQ